MQQIIEHTNMTSAARRSSKIGGGAELYTDNASQITFAEAQERSKMIGFQIYYANNRPKYILLPASNDWPLSAY